jgi:cell wall-associated NlpC family hydrolase
MTMNLNFIKKHRHFRINNFKFFALIMIATSCTMTDNETISKNLKVDLDSLKEIYAPDSRIVVWNVSIENQSDTLKLFADIESQSAKDGIQKLIAEKYPEVLTEVNLLPENEPDRLIHAIVNNSVASIRSDPKHRAELVNQAFLGTPIRILKKKGGWYLAQTPNYYLGWINADDISLIDEEELKNYKQASKILFNEQTGSSYSEPNTNSQVVSDLVIGCILPVLSSQGNFYKVKYPDGRTAYVMKAETIDMMTVFKRRPDGKRLVDCAKKFNGIPYLWGGFSSKAIDCSGFTSTVYFINGIVLQRDASQQIRYGTEISDQFDYQNLLPGDLLFFGRRATSSHPAEVTHVGMYIGDTEFIHASGKVKINSIDSTRANYLSGYRDSFIKTMRVIGNEGKEGIDNITENNFYKNIIPDLK